MTSKALSFAIAIGCGLLPVLLASNASANGKFPAANHILVDPSDPAHIVTRTTFGFVTTRDDGESWDWICEDGAGYANLDPPFSIAGGGALVLGFFDGMSVTSADTCDFSRDPSFVGKWVTDTTIQANSPSSVVVSVGEPGGNVDQVWKSNDSGGSWAQMGVDLPSNFFTKTLDLAPSDPMRVYVTGDNSIGGGHKGQLARSKDGGASWEVFDIPGSASGTLPFLAAVDPQDADRLYVRLDGAPGKLLVSEDGGASFQTIFTSSGFLKGFALSPDGSTVIAGSDTDGVWRASTTDYAFSQASGTKVLCLRWEAAGLYACADEDTEGFTVGLSTDEGATFTPKLHRPCIRGPLACDSGTDVGGVCPGLWPAMMASLGIVDCSSEGQGGGGGGAEAGTGGGSSATSTTGSGGNDGDGGGGGCGCKVAGDLEGNETPALFGLALLTLGASLRRKRPLLRR